MRITETQFVELLGQKARRYGRRLPGASCLSRGIGDDCAVITASAENDLLITTDLFLEEVHFRRPWQEPRSVGHKVLARGLSDIAAMGGIPRYAFLSLGLPVALEAAWSEDFFTGFFKLAKAAKVILAGGDTGRSRGGFLADIIVLGEVPRGEAVLRSGASPGDQIWVTGQLGLAATGLALLEKSGARAHSEKHHREALQSFLFPQPRFSIGLFLRERKLASAMIDLSDGLSIDLARLCQESGVGARIFEDSIPRTADTAMLDALHGGEDLELLFTVPRTLSRHLPRSIAGVKITQIGEIIAKARAAGKKRPGNLLLVRGDKESPLPVLGFQHF